MELHKMAFTVDVEDGINLAMRDYFGKPMPPTNRVVKNTQLILDLLDKYQIKGTFFTLGEVAKHYPNLVKQIAEKGHEVGAHGYYHYQFYRLNPKSAKKELQDAKDILEDTIGREVIGHRAPAFSINQETSWVLEILAELGFKYDSSIMPIKASRYGWPGFNDSIHTINLPGGKALIEVPLSHAKVIGKEIPIGGGSYFRLTPLWVTQKLLKRVLKTKPGIFYIHPYEVDTERYPDYYFDELKNVGLKKRLGIKSFWVNRSNMASKLESLISTFQFCSIESLLRENNMVSNQ